LREARDVRLAVLMMAAGLELGQARELLEANKGVLRSALAAAGKEA
jgi:N-acetylmuramic acid 6-phosphate (MurNAc-6-P) etherase